MARLTDDRRVSAATAAELTANGVDDCGRYRTVWTALDARPQPL